MAMTKCRECGQKVSTKAKACVACGAPVKHKSSAISKLFAFIFFLLVLMIIIPAMSDASGGPRSASAKPAQNPAAAKAPQAKKAKPPKPADVSATIAFTGTQFIIANNNTYDWTNVKMHINSGVFSGGYKLSVERLAAGNEYSVGAAQFTKSSGERFNPFTHKPKDFMIDCDQGLFTGGWN